MSTLLVTRNDEKFYDLSFDSNGQFNELDGAAEIAQNILTALYLIQGEWFLNITEGIDYFGVVFVPGTSRLAIDQLFISEILAVNGVQSLISYNSNFDTALRNLEITFNVDTVLGETGIQTVEINI